MKMHMMKEMESKMEDKGEVSEKKEKKLTKTKKQMTSDGYMPKRKK